MGSDNAREKRGMVLPSRKKKVGGVAGNSNLFVLLLCVGAVFAAGLFVSFLHFVNYASDNHNNHAFEKMTRSQPVQTTRGEIRSSAFFGTDETPRSLRNDGPEEAAQRAKEQKRDILDKDEESTKHEMKERMKKKMAGFQKGEMNPQIPKEASTPKNIHRELPGTPRDNTKVDRSFSLPLYGDNWGEIGIHGFGDPESGSGTISGWFYLDPKNKGNRMKTLFANRDAGCDISADRYGFAVYVNHWNTNNLAVEVDIGAKNKGCHHMNTGPGIFEYGKWMHVALTMYTPNPNDQTTFTLYVNFAKKVSMRVNREGTRSTYPLRIGAHLDGEAGFIGNVSEVLVFDKTMISVPGDTLSKEVRGDVVLSEESADLIGYYPLYYPKPYTKKTFYSFVDKSKTQGKGVVTRTTKRLLGHPIAVKADSKMQSEVAADMNFSPVILASGVYSDNVKDAVRESLMAKATSRALAVKAGMQHCWKNYKSHAWGMDELKPVSGRGDNNWGGMGMTLLDSLDTLWVMGMREEFFEAKDWVQKSLSFNKNRMVSTFETTIRALGGLLSAYDLSEEPIFLEKAKDLGARLFKAFSTPSGMPNGQINLATGSSANAGWTGSAAILAEVGTLQLEFRYLSKVINNPMYGDVATNVFKTLRNKNQMPDGLAPIYVSPQSGTFTTGRVTFGALGDSYYEYLLKTWLQGGKKETFLREMYDNAMNGVASKLLQRSTPSNLAYVGDWSGHGIEHKMDHLACFLPGLLALGAYTDPENKNAKRDMTIAKSMMYTCYQMYRRTATGIAAEFVEFPGGHDLQPASRAPFYILRPETAESMFVLYQVTGNPMYQEWAWDIFAAINKYSKTSFGYGSWPDVRQTNRRPDDRMESFWLEETLKYLYLVQAPMSEHKIDLTKYVFNTECHPTRIFPLIDAKVQPQIIGKR